jgi:hypothetical protein
LATFVTDLRALGGLAKFLQDSWEFGQWAQLLKHPREHWRSALRAFGSLAAVAFAHQLGPLLAPTTVGLGLAGLDQHQDLLAHLRLKVLFFCLLRLIPLLVLWLVAALVPLLAL